MKQIVSKNNSISSDEIEKNWYFGFEAENGKTILFSRSNIIAEISKAGHYLSIYNGSFSDYLEELLENYPIYQFNTFEEVLKWFNN